MELFLTGALIGMVLGGVFGVCIMALMFAAKQGDKYMVEDQHE